MQEGNTHMKTKTHAVLLALAACLCAGGAGAVETVPAGAPDHGARTFWDAAAWTQPPRTFPVEVPCSNEYGRVAGVEPVWIEGEPWRGRPTRVFAWWGLPRGASAQRKVPAMVLVHGGGAPLVAVKAAEVRDGRLCVAFDAGGRRVARAELLATEDANPFLERRAWSATPVPGFDGTRTSLAVPVPARAVMFFVNLITDDGLVVSTRIFMRE